MSIACTRCRMTDPLHMAIPTAPHPLARAAISGKPVGYGILLMATNAPGISSDNINKAAICFNPTRSALPQAIKKLQLQGL